MLTEMNNESVGCFDEDYSHDILFRRYHKYILDSIPPGGEKERLNTPRQPMHVNIYFTRLRNSNSNLTLKLLTCDRTSSNCVVISKINLSQLFDKLCPKAKAFSRMLLGKKVKIEYTIFEQKSCATM